MFADNLEVKFSACMSRLVRHESSYAGTCDAALQFQVTR